MNPGLEKSRRARRLKRLSLAILALGALQIFSLTVSADSDEEGNVAISSMVAPTYIRSKQPDGTLVPETYVFCEGGGSVANRDDSLDRVTFKDVVQITSKALSKQNYLPAKDPSQAKLMITIYWGSTWGGTDRRNAVLMGYESDLRKSIEYSGTALAWRSLTIMDEMRGGMDPAHPLGGWGRYYVAVIAYDYQMLRSKKKEKALWMTRFSIPGRGNYFNEQLPSMSVAAARYFGKSSDGLKHKELPQGRVEAGELKVLDTEP